MSKKVALTSYHYKDLVCEEAQNMLISAGFELVCNDLGRRLTKTEQKEMVADAYAVITGTEPYDTDVLSVMEKCAVICRLGVGTDNYDLPAMREKGIQVGIIANHNAVAEFTLTMMLAMLKKLPLYDSSVRKGSWSRFEMRELNGKTVGLVGYGRIAKRLAELLCGFGVTILAYSPHIKAEDAAKRNVTAVSFDELLTRSDIVSLHLPLTDGNYHLFDAQTFSKMKVGAYFINTSRGHLVDESALRSALDSGKLSGAGLDVFEIEPVVKGNPLFSMDNDVLSPHCAALTYETNYNAGIICAQSIINVSNGGHPVCRVI